MTLVPALAAFVAAAILITVTPGLDTALVLRTGAVEGPRRGALTALGVCCGLMVWGLAVALGLGVLLAASHAAYLALQLAGAAYLIWLGAGLILRPRSKLDLRPQPRARGNWWLRGFLNNLLNPKVGVFYVSFLPQFVPAGVPPAPFIVLLAAIHFVIGIGWLGLIAASTAPLKRWLANARAVRWLDRVTGAVFVGFGLRLAFDRR